MIGGQFSNRLFPIQETMEIYCCENCGMVTILPEWRSKCPVCSYNMPKRSKDEWLESEETEHRYRISHKSTRTVSSSYKCQLSRIVTYLNLYFYDNGQTLAVARAYKHGNIKTSISNVTYSVGWEYLRNDQPFKGLTDWMEKKYGPKPRSLNYHNRFPHWDFEINNIYYFADLLYHYKNDKRCFRNWSLLKRVDRLKPPIDELKRLLFIHEDDAESIFQHIKKGDEYGIAALKAYQRIKNKRNFIKAYNEEIEKNQVKNDDFNMPF